MPDPGLVLTGTKCGDGMVSLAPTLMIHFVVLLKDSRACRLLDVLEPPVPERQRFRRARVRRQVQRARGESTMTSSARPRHHFNSMLVRRFCATHPEVRWRLLFTN